MKLAKKPVALLLLVIIITSMLPLQASGSGVIAWGAANITGSGVRIRSGPGLNHEVLAHVNRGDVVVVVEQTNSEWHKVNFHGTVGFINVPFLDNSRKAANFNAAGGINGSNVNMRARPDTTSDILGTHNTGTIMKIIGINEGWYKVEHGSQTGYIRSDLMNVLSRGTATTAASASSGSTRVTPTVPAPDPNMALGQQIAEYALGFLGTRYVRGGSSPSGFDCSGFVTYVKRQFNISVTRNASGQYRDNGTHINKSELVPGDLVFFSNNGGRSVTHVGIYIGDGRFVHASNSRVGVITSSLNSAYYTRVWHGAKRIV